MLLFISFNDDLGNPENKQLSSSLTSFASSDHADVKSRKTKAVTPEKDSIKRKKTQKYSDQSYEELEGLVPEELRTLNRMQEDADRAADAYEELFDVETELKEEVKNLLYTKNKYDCMVSSFKDYLDLKYRSK
jgi:hypothetical protein